MTEEPTTEATPSAASRPVPGPVPNAVSGPTGRTPEEDGVDRVVADVESLDERPLEEHVAVFEQAHEELRAALDGRTTTA